MAKKKNKKNQSSNKKKNFTPLIAIGAVLLLGVGYFAYSAQQAGSVSARMAAVNEIPDTSYAERTAGMNLIETKAIVPAKYFRGSTAQIYQWAAEIPQVFDKLFCYCMCKSNPRFRHKNLLTCYTDSHASKCGICMKEGVMAHKMTEDGKSPSEIQEAIDGAFARNKSSRSFF